MLSLNRPINYFHRMKEMQENGSPDEVRKDDRADDLAGQRGTGSGKDSPHSTTGTPPSSRQRQAARCNDDDQSVDHQVNDDKNASSASSATYTTQALKDVLSAALQLSGSISRQHSERSLQIVTDLLIGSIDSNQFQQRLAQVIDVPFRPIVPPLLDKQLPLLRREMASRLQPVRLASAGSAQLQTTAQYMMEHVKSLLSPDQPASLLTAGDKLGVWQVFQPAGRAGESGKTRKRRASTSLVEQGKRMNADDQTRWTPAKVNNNGPAVLEVAETSSSSSMTKSSSYSVPSALMPFQQQQPQADEEWANIHTMLNCILSMVEKTRRALGILQQRAVDHHQQHQQKRSSSLQQQHQAYEASELRRQAGELIAQTLKATEDRVTQVKRKAEEAVHDVRRAAMAELQRALSAERIRAERLAAEARRQGAEEALSALGQHAMGPGSHHQSNNNNNSNKEVCWNCGRRANETCSGCNVARYCSTFCQHKHWEVHHKICGRVSQLMLAAAAASTASAPSSDHRNETAGSVGSAASPSPSHLSSAGRRNSARSKTPSPVQQPTSGSYVH